MNRIACLLIAALLALAAPLAAKDARPLPADSVYLLEDVYTDQAGKDFRLAEGRGKPRLVAMFYTSCRYVCPLIVDSARGVERALEPAERERLGILLVSLDPARDDVAALKSVFDKRRLDPARWTLARTGAAGVRRLAAVLGVRYRPLADGEFNHTSALVLLDAEGRVLARTERLGAVPDPDFMAALRASLARSTTAD
ncbi:SCO family protein [Arenimonas fontis]|uniref:SCO family protein n=1 Tax=Arenimonas fontis TaxID=2608255 RepID=A0A5B2ZC32_9GAMM|nr:SCO family protein [Arenimonas fontis]KAA2284840.1 SCO family protein [Arenimonas fontis]